jgi:hypothetical protein
VIKCPIDPFRTEYSYVQVAVNVEWRITESEITQKLPSERSFAAEYRSRAGGSRWRGMLAQYASPHDGPPLSRSASG